MKGKILLLLLFAISTGLNAQVIPNPIPVHPPFGKPKGMTDSPHVAASYTSDTLTVSITGYFGDVEVAIEEEDTATEMCTQTAYVSWQATITTDIQNLPAGDYILRIRLEDDEEYVGYFSK